MKNVITAQDPRVQALAEAWGTTPDLVLREAIDIRNTAVDRGHPEYTLDELLDAATVTTDMIAQGIISLT